MPDEVSKLKPVCSTDPTRENIATPFASTFWGKRWLCATDGHGLAAYPLNGEEPANKSGPDVSQIMLDGWKPTHKTTLAALRGWVAMERACGSCGIKHECNAPPPERPEREARILVAALNRNLLSRVLFTAPDDGEVVLAISRPEEPFILRSGEWAAAVMPMRLTLDGLPEFTALEPL
jgi:hypothetical protein